MSDNGCGCGKKGRKSGSVKRKPGIECGPGPVCQAASFSACQAISTMLQKGNLAADTAENREVMVSTTHPELRQP